MIIKIDEYIKLKKVNYIFKYSSIDSIEHQCGLLIIYDRNNVKVTDLDVNEIFDMTNNSVNKNLHSYYYCNCEVNSISKKILIMYAKSDRKYIDDTVEINNKQIIDILLGDLNTVTKISATNIINYASILEDDFYKQIENITKFHTCKKFRIPLLQQQFSKIEKDPDIDNINNISSKDYVIIRGNKNQPETYTFQQQENMLVKHDQDINSDVQTINESLPWLPNTNHFSDHFLIKRKINNDEFAFTLNVAADNEILLEYYIDKLKDFYNLCYDVWKTNENTLTQITHNI